MKDGKEQTKKGKKMDLQRYLPINTDSALEAILESLQHIYMEVWA